MEETDAAAVTELAADNCIIVGDLQQQSPASRLYLIICRTGCIIYTRLLSRESKYVLDHCQSNHGCLSVCLFCECYIIQYYVVKCYSAQTLNNGAMLPFAECVMCFMRVMR